MSRAKKDKASASSPTPPVNAASPSSSSSKSSPPTGAGKGTSSGDTHVHPRPPRGPGWTTIFTFIVAILITFLVASEWGGAIVGEAKKAWVTLVQNDEHAGHNHGTDGKKTFFTCGMHPWVVLPREGDCPICQMKLTPLDPNKFTGEVSISPLITQNIGVRIEPVKTGALEKTIRTVGTIQYDETHLRDVNIKVNGWIEKLNIDYLGAAVKENEPLFELYSPQLYAAQEEYLLAWKNKDRVGADFVPDAATGARDLLESARVKLEYFDITPEQIAALEKAGKPSKTMTIRSPHTGVVIEKHANEGMKVDTGMRVYRIADLSKVWVMVTLYEHQLPFVSVGQRGIMSLPYIPGQTLEGKVIYLYPYLEEQTRQVKVRLEFDNPGQLLKPGMYANVELKSTLASECTLAPRSAIIDTGERQVAFVSLGEGKFEPRNVQMGVEMNDGYVQVLDGLKPGEKVVVSGQFLIDSEAKIRESLAKMIKGEMASDQIASVATVGESELKSMPDPLAEALTVLLDRYLAIGKTLAGDSNKGIAPPARDIATSIDRMLSVELTDHPHFWHKHDEAATVRGKALELVGATSIEKAREAYAVMSVAMAKLINATGVPPTYSSEVQQLHCPMYREGQGGSTWLQPAGDVRNPFYGSKMLKCFDKRKAIPVTGGSNDTKNKSPETSKSSTPVDSKDGQTNSKLLKLSPQIQKHVDALFSTYFEIQEDFAKDRIEGSNEKRKTLHHAASALIEHPQLGPPARAIAVAASSSFDNLSQARTLFKSISIPAIELARLAPPTNGVTPIVYQAHCPMAKASWLQKSEKVFNPYYGSQMLRCGKVTNKFNTPAVSKD